MSLFLFLSVLQAVVAAALVTVVLMQRSEGGGLGMGGGGSPGGVMSARGAADFLTHTTKWLAVSFVVEYIMGQKTDENWESFKQSWYELGGTDWTNEVNAQYNNIINPQ